MATTAQHKKDKPYLAICPGCGRKHHVNTETFVMFGVDTYCLPCINRDHLLFMQRNARRLGLSCVAGCICGFGGAA